MVRYFQHVDTILVYVPSNYRERVLKAVGRKGYYLCQSLGTVFFEVHKPDLKNLVRVSLRRLP